MSFNHIKLPPNFPYRGMRFTSGVDSFELIYCCHRDHWKGSNRVWVCKKTSTGCYQPQFNVWDDDFFVENNKIYANVDLEPVTWP